MAKPSEAAQRRHVRERGVIDHLAEKVFESFTETAPDHTVQNSTTDTGLPVEGQVRKEWNPQKGGLPTF
jgi:hypothetical protein